MPSEVSAKMLPHRLGNLQKLIGGFCYLLAGVRLKRYRSSPEAPTKPAVLGDRRSHWGRSGDRAEAIDEAAGGTGRHHGRNQQERITGEVSEHAFQGIHLPGGEDDRYQDQVGGLHRSIGQGVGSGVGVDDDEGILPLPRPRGQAICH